MNTFKTFFDKPLRSLTAAALAISVTGTPLAAQAPNAQLDQAVAALRGISTMTADFTQTDRNGQRLAGQIGRASCRERV